jgi:glutathione synthase/RimK-type ligase-like ATP-grasp enzyme
MSPEGLGGSGEEVSLTDRIRDSLVQASPEHGDLIMGRDVVVTTWCEANGISKDDITIDQLLEIRALPEWQDPFNIQPSTE